MHAKMQLEGVCDLNDQRPEFLKLCSVACKDFNIDIKVEEIQVSLNGDDESKMEIYFRKRLSKVLGSKMRENS
jgi:hypothetical protein